MNPNPAQFGGSFQQPSPGRPKGCWGRYWKVIVPAGCLSLILAAVVAVAGLLFAAMSALKSSEVYQGALKIAQSHPAAVGRLGEPVRDGWLVKGSVSYDAAGGAADFEIPLSGPKNSGTLFVRAVNPEGAWMYERLDLSVAGGETLSLLDRRPDQPPASPPVDVEEDADDAVAVDEGEAAETPPPSDGPTVSAGALDAKAVSRPLPPYPPLAKAARASGTVTVRVTVDETGHVVSAAAVSGHPLLRAAAVAAARQARFAPTLEGGEPARVSGTLTYDFEPEQ
ncbi:MAG TPA: cytochrome c oxidase assembly factor Coa1 family protein [Pyrinomonadaceae bacterium]